MSEYSVIVSKKSVDNRNHKVLITGSKTIKRKLAYIFNIVMIVFSLPTAICGLWLWNTNGLAFRLPLSMGYDFKIHMIGMLSGLILGIPASIIFRCIGKKVAAYVYGYEFEKGHFLNWLRRTDDMADRFGGIKKCQIQLAGIELDLLLIGLSLIMFNLTAFGFFIYFAVMMAPYTLFNFSFIFICDGANALNELIKRRDSKHVCEQAYEKTAIEVDNSSGEWKRYFFLREILLKEKSRADLFDVAFDKEYLSDRGSRFEEAVCFIFRVLLAAGNLYAVILVIGMVVAS